MRSLSRRTFLLLTGAAALAGIPTLAADPAPPAATSTIPPSMEGKALFDGESLAGWKVTDFAGRGEVKVEKGQIILEAGNDLTGITLAGETPKTGYELLAEVMRLEGGDFFCGLTFPVGETCVTYVVGGWGGSVVGISSINGDDASENATTQFRKLESNKWYKVRVRVTATLVETWLDDEQMAKVERADKQFGMRAGEIELSQPMGFATFRTKAAVRNIRLKKVE